MSVSQAGGLIESEPLRLQDCTCIACCLNAEAGISIYSLWRLTLTNPKITACQPGWLPRYLAYYRPLRSTWSLTWRSFLTITILRVPEMLRCRWWVVHAIRSFPSSHASRKPQALTSLVFQTITDTIKIRFDDPSRWTEEYIAWVFSTLEMCSDEYGSTLVLVMSQRPADLQTCKEPTWKLTRSSKSLSYVESVTMSDFSTYLWNSEGCALAPARAKSPWGNTRVSMKYAAANALRVGLLFLLKD